MASFEGIVVDESIMAIDDVIRAITVCRDSYAKITDIAKQFSNDINSDEVTAPGNAMNTIKEKMTELTKVIVDSGEPASQVLNGFGKYLYEVSGVEAAAMEAARNV